MGGPSVGEFNMRPQEEGVSLVMPEQQQCTSIDNTGTSGKLKNTLPMRYLLSTDGEMQQTNHGGTNMPSTREVKAGRLGVQSQPWLCREFETSLGYMRTYLKENKEMQIRNALTCPHYFLSWE